MKRLFLGVLVFAIILFSVTGILIKLKTNDIEKEVFSTNYNNELEDVVEKTLDLCETYDQNDLKIEKVSVKMDFFDNAINIPVISGLRNKKVENKINNDIRKKIEAKVQELFNKYGNKEISTWSSIESNFANVISIRWDITLYREKNNHNQESRIEEIIGLNYELINGNTIQFEDLFIKDIDLYGISRRAFYRKMSSDYTNANVYFNEKTGEWETSHFVYDPEQEKYVDESELYVPELTEYDINKMIKKFIKQEEKNFFFSPSRVYILTENISYPLSYYLDFEDMIDKIVIYDKYLTKESLYDEVNIGLKNLWACSEPKEKEYLIYGFAEDNLYYEIDLPGRVDESDYPFSNSLEEVERKLIELANKKLEEYKKIAREDKENFYIVSLHPSAQYSYNRATYYPNRKYYNLIESYLSEKTACIDNSLKEKFMNELIPKYREANDNVVSNFLNTYYTGGYLIETEYNGRLESKNERKIYDARNLCEVTDIKSVFKPGIDYMNILKSELNEKIKDYSYFAESELNEFVDNATFTLKASGFTVEQQLGNRIITIEFKDFEEEMLTVYDIEFYVIPESSIRKIEKNEIENLTLDELNKGYNEIFARYGHDFKNAELKEYFKKLSWYNAVDNKVVNLEELNENEKYNLDVIKTVIAEKNEI